MVVANETGRHSQVNYEDSTIAKDREGYTRGMTSRLVFCVIKQSALYTVPAIEGIPFKSTPSYISQGRRTIRNTRGFVPGEESPAAGHNLLYVEE